MNEIYSDIKKDLLIWTLRTGFFTKVPEVKK